MFSTLRNGSCSLRTIACCLPLALIASAAWSDSRTAIEQNNIGVAYMNQYSYTEAAAAFRKAVDADAAFNQARINLGLALLYKQDYDEAQSTLQDALTREPASPHIHYSLGLIHKNRGEYEQSVEHFLRVTQLDPKDSASFYNLGVLRARLRSNEQAESALRRSLELDPLNTSAMYNLGSLLLKTGRAEEGNRILEQFRALQQKGEAGGGTGMGNQYGEMGAYAMAMEYKPVVSSVTLAPKPLDASAPFKVTTREAGLGELGVNTSPFQSVSEFSSAEWSLEYLKSRLLPELGGGVALSDLDNDGDVDAVITRFQQQRRAWETYLLRNDGKGRFTDISSSSGIKNSGGQISAAIGDYDNDMLPDIYLAGLGGNRLFRNLGQWRFQDVTATAKVGDDGVSLSGAFVDYDHDGDLDLYVCHYVDASQVPAGGQLKFPSSLAGSSNRVYRNNGDGTFADYTSVLGVGGGNHRSLGMIATDLDNDRDIDMVVLNDDAPPQLFTNDRNDRFTEIFRKAGPGIETASRALTVADFNRDGAMDFFLSGGEQGRNFLLLNKGDGSLQADSRSAALLARASRWGSGALDYDRDGDLDLYLLGEKDGGSLWENAGDGSFAFAGRLTGFAAGGGSAAADLNGDGRVDILCLDSFGNPQVWQNETGNSSHWVAVQLEGLRSNKLGLGAKVEIRAGALYQKFEVQGHGGHLSQDSQMVWFGLDSTKVDSITVRWPSGILQSEINVAADRVVRVKELDRKGTSCPLLYAWNGKQFEFVTDFLGGCAIGYLQAPGRYSTPDTDEYIRIEGSQLMPRDGKYLLSLNNQLEEVIMFDQARLLVVDHPAATEVYPNERLMPGPPFPEFKIITASNARPPRSAVDQQGEDILPLIASKDRVYPDRFRSLPFKGYAEAHSITLDLGNLSGSKKVVLLMDAWIDYADSSSNLAASQAGVALIPPLLQTKDKIGEWKTVIPSLGFPAGLPKTMTVDLTGKFPSDDYRVRIVTSMKIYWDRIRVDTSDHGEIRVTRLEPEAADLHFRGYPVYYTPDGKLPWIYDYSRILPFELWGVHAGAYTRFGDVRELLLEKDDMFVITRHGDEVSLRFDAGSVPQLPAGWARDYLLYADGYGKDMDINSLYPEVMGPLPFHGMSKFPYSSSEKYPDDEEHRSYRRRYNTRVFPVPAPRPAVTQNKYR
jgi:tetratricopeptide (TPR) repeat protein